MNDRPDPDRADDRSKARRPGILLEIDRDGRVLKAEFLRQSEGEWGSNNSLPCRVRLGQPNPARPEAAPGAAPRPCALRRWLRRVGRILSRLVRRRAEPTPP